MEAIKILFTGDFCPHNRIEALSAKKDFNAIYNNFIDVFNGNDLNVTDIECPLTETKSRIQKTGPYQFAASHTIEILKHANFKLAAMANNHMMDCDAAGALDTIELCKNAGIETVGIGITEAARRKHFSINIKGKKIAIFNIAENEFIETPGGEIAANALNLVKNYYDITAAKNEHDVVILMLHGGNEFHPLPAPRIKETCRFFIDIGVDAIVSYHTHCFSGYEVYKGKPIFYGLGNFIYDDPGKQDTSWNFGLIVKFIITDTISFEIIPVKQNSGVPGLFHPTEIELQSIHKKLEDLNAVIQNDEKLSSAFNEYCTSVNPMYTTYIEPFFGKFVASLRARGLFPKLMNARKRRLLLNIIRCESHRDALINILSKK